MYTKSFRPCSDLLLAALNVKTWKKHVGSQVVLGCKWRKKGYNFVVDITNPGSYHHQSKVTTSQ